MALPAALRRFVSRLNSNASSKAPASMMMESLEFRRHLTATVNADFNGDGHQDLVFRNYSTGANAIWFQNGQTSLAKVIIRSAPDTNWQVGAVADINHDGTPDLIWHNASTLQNAVWYLSVSGFNVTVTSVDTSFRATTDPAWQLAGANNFTTANKPDLVWRNINDGRVALWTLDAAAPGGDYTLVTAIHIVGTAPNSAWVVKGTGDFDGDGKPDIVFRNIATGDNAYWSVVNDVATSSSLFRAATNTAWQLSSAQDVDGDGKADLIWRNGSTGQNAVWLMNGTTVTTVYTLDAAPNTDWQIAGGQVL